MNSQYHNAFLRPVCAQTLGRSRPTKRALRLWGFALCTIIAACGGSTVTTGDGSAAAGGDGTGAVAGAGGAAAGSPGMGAVGSQGGFDAGVAGGPPDGGQLDGADAGEPTLHCGRLEQQSSERVLLPNAARVTAPRLTVTGPADVALTYQQHLKPTDPLLLQHFFTPWTAAGIGDLLDGFSVGFHTVLDHVTDRGGSRDVYSILAASGGQLRFSLGQGQGAYPAQSVQGSNPQFISHRAPGEAGSLLGFQSGLGGVTVGLAPSGPDAFRPLRSLGCNSRAHARAVAVPSGWVVAVSGPPSAAWCDVPDPTSLSSSIHLVVVTPTEQITWNDTQLDPSSSATQFEVDQVEFVPTVEGGWLFWTYSGPGTDTPIYGCRVTADGRLLGVPIEVGSTGTSSDEFAVAVFGDAGPIVTVVTKENVAPPAALVAVHDTSGLRLAEHEFWGEPTLGMQGPYSVAAEPGGDRLLVAAGDGANHLYVTRLFCAEE